MLMSAVPVTSMQAPQRRRRDAAALLALVALGLVVTAAVLVNVHPLELKGDSAGKLFASALKSQEASRAKHKVAEQKLKAQVESNVAREDGLSATQTKPLTDAALFKMAYKSQQTDLKKKDASIEALKAQATKKHDTIAGLPSSKAAQLSDAKLFQAALKEQNDERSKDKDALKLDVKAELKKNAAGADTSLKAQQTKMKSELKMILQANGDNSDEHAKSTKPVLKAKMARTQSLATVDAHKRHKAAATAKKTAHSAPVVHAAAKPAAAKPAAAKPAAAKPSAAKPAAAKPAGGLPAATVKLHGPLPTESKLYKDALSREGKSKLNDSKKHAHKSAKDPEALAKAHAAMEKKSAARKAKQQESVAQEKKLVAFLDSAGGSEVKPVRAPKTVTLAERAKKEDKVKKAAAAEKKMKTVVKLAAKYRTGRSEERQGGGWAQTAMTAAADKLGKGGKDEFRRTEFARADAIEASLVGPSSHVGSSLKSRGRTTA